MGILNFDARTVQPFIGYETYPEGWYKVLVNTSNIKQTSKGDSGMLVLGLLILDGPYKDKSIPYNLNLWNINPQSVEMAYKQLSAVMLVIGVMTIQDTPNPNAMAIGLHNIPFFVYVTIVSGEKGTLNNIKMVKDINGNDPKPHPVTAQAQPNAPPPGFGQQPTSPAPNGQLSLQPPAPAQPAGALPWGPGIATAPAADPSWAPSGGAPQAQPAQAQPAWQPSTSGAPGGNPPWQK